MANKKTLKERTVETLKNFNQKLALIALDLIKSGDNATDEDKLVGAFVSSLGVRICGTLHAINNLEESLAEFEKEKENEGEKYDA